MKQLHRLLFTLSLLLAFTHNLRAAPPVGKSQQLTSPDQVPEGLAKSDWASIHAAYEVGRHAFTPVTGGWQARNPGQQWLTRFDGRGFVAEPSGGGWQWGLELKSYGFPGDERAISGVPAVKAEGQRLTYRWDAAVEEWFVNDARGLEHGYTVRERPAGAEAGAPLQFNLAVRGSLAAQVEADGLGVEFRDTAGAVVLRYGGLKVWDADGKALSAHFAPTVHLANAALRLLVEERGARYPITVDPIAQQAQLKASNTGANDFFGIPVAVSGDTVVVGAYQEDGSGTGVNPASNEGATDAGAAYVFVRSGTSWSQQAYLKPSNTGAGDYFGYSVAVSGDTVVVGAVEEDGNGTGVNPPDNNLGSGAGAAYVFVRSGTSWSQQAYLKASNSGLFDHFGYSVAVSGDTVVVGADQEDGSGTGVNPADNNLAHDAGAAYVFVRTGSSWSQQARLKASNTGADDNFGQSVAVSGDTVVVGARYEDGSGNGVNPPSNEGALSAGAAYVFVRSGTSWSQQAYLKASNTEAGDNFGIVAVSGDTAVIGAWFEDGSGTGVNPADNNLANNAGAAYVFVRTGTSWSQQAYLKASNTEAFDTFGQSVAVAGDTVVVGASNEAGSGTGVNPPDDNLAINAGAAYVFVRSGTSWSEQARLKASNTGAGDGFGLSFAVAVSGDTVVVGAPLEDGSGTGVNPPDDNLASSAGAAYVFLVSLDTPPVITCPSLGPVQCFADVPAAATDLASFMAQGGTVSGGCSTPTVVLISETLVGACPQTITRIYRATDTCGGSVDCTQTITVDDTTAPVISAAGADAPIECSATISFTPPTATDNCDPAPMIVELSDVPTPPTCAGSYTRTKTWHAVDSCGNVSAAVSQTITVRDTTPPVIGAPGADSITECSAPIVFTPPTATDNCDPAPMIVQESPDTTTPPTCAGSYTLTRRWHAVDACGNVSATVSQTITVEDTTPPVISTPAPVAPIECPATPSFTAPTATDNCDPTPVVVQESPDIITPGTCAGSFTQTRRWHAVDACGNVSATVSQTITVEDTTPPTITCPADISISTGPSPVTFSAAATDACDPAPIVTFNPPSGSVFPLGTTIVSCEARDACGSVSSCSFSVTVTAPSGATSFTSTTPVGLRPGRSIGRANPYPSSINVSGLAGSISHISVTLHGLTHSRPDDLDILLVGPGGQTVRLMSDCGGSTGIAGLELTFDDAAAAMIPNRGPITPGISYKPTNYRRWDFFPSPAPRPGGGYGSAFAVFAGLPANGTWSLFVRDDAVRNIGAISGGWSLNITTD